MYACDALINVNLGQ